MSAVWLVIGVQAAGKSTVAQGLAEAFPRSVHVRGDQLRRWAVNGWVQPGEGDGAEARRLLDLRYRLSARLADGYCEAGFTTVVQDNLYGADVEAWLGAVAARPRHLVVLRPRVEVVAARDAARRAATGKVAYRPDGSTIEGLDRALGVVPGIGLWLDTSDLTPAETVAEVLARADEARLDP
ncbi:MAG TPA: AAA family ATPase [Iamia sp.]|nr:AAA family ATPase [Iamia sp.]